MNAAQRFPIFLLRLSLGWLFLYAGISKILGPHWSAAGYISAAKTFPHLYAFFLQPNILPTVNILNEYGLALIGVSLIIGLFVRISSLFGILLMALYYFAALQFPHIGTTSYIVDEHVIYILCLLVLSAFDAGRYWGMERR